LGRAAARTPQRRLGAWFLTTPWQPHLIRGGADGDSRTIGACPRGQSRRVITLRPLRSSPEIDVPYVSLQKLVVVE
jgi:hypothetical protein